ncbi:MAG: LysM peptidoglycan-binding domain-containing protein, partial [Actinomycetota bacterium]|nr:LysM peptidoglycan-binding domain-containing protein [Actinomycetota bacterium]
WAVVSRAFPTGPWSVRAAWAATAERGGSSPAPALVTAATRAGGDALALRADGDGVPVRAGGSAQPVRQSDSVNVDWPVHRPSTTPRPEPVDLDWPTSSPAHSSHQHPTTGTQVVVVRPGDSLWLIAADQLGQGADDATIDAQWRRWYRANRSVIGFDPDLIQPGQHLRAPTHPPITPPIPTDRTEH